MPTSATVFDNRIAQWQKETNLPFSVVSINRYSIPYHTAFLNGDLIEALDQLGTRRATAKAFDTAMTTYVSSITTSCAVAGSISNRASNHDIVCGFA